MIRRGGNHHYTFPSSSSSSSPSPPSSVVNDMNHTTTTVRNTGTTSTVASIAGNSSNYDAMMVSSTSRPTVDNNNNNTNRVPEATSTDAMSLLLELDRPGGGGYNHTIDDYIPSSVSPISTPTRQSTISVLDRRRRETTTSPSPPTTTTTTTTTKSSIGRPNNNDEIRLSTATTTSHALSNNEHHRHHNPSNSASIATTTAVPSSTTATATTTTTTTSSFLSKWMERMVSSTVTATADETFTNQQQVSIRRRHFHFDNTTDDDDHHVEYDEINHNNEDNGRDNRTTGSSSSAPRQSTTSTSISQDTNDRILHSYLHKYQQQQQQQQQEKSTTYPTTTTTAVVENNVAINQRNVSTNSKKRNTSSSSSTRYDTKRNIDDENGNDNDDDQSHIIVVPIPATNKSRVKLSSSGSHTTTSNKPSSSTRRLLSTDTTTRRTNSNNNNNNQSIDRTPPRTNVRTTTSTSINRTIRVEPKVEVDTFMNKNNNDNNTSIDGTDEYFINLMSSSMNTTPSPSKQLQQHQKVISPFSPSLSSSHRKRRRQLYPQQQQQATTTSSEVFTTTNTIDSIQNDNNDDDVSITTILNTSNISLSTCRKVSVVVSIRSLVQSSNQNKSTPNRISNPTSNNVFLFPSNTVMNETCTPTRNPIPMVSSKELIVVNPTAVLGHNNNSDSRSNNTNSNPLLQTMEMAKMISQMTPNQSSEDWIQLYQYHYILWWTNNPSVMSTGTTSIPSSSNLDTIESVYHICQAIVNDIMAPGSIAHRTVIGTGTTTTTTPTAKRSTTVTNHKNVTNMELQQTQQLFGHIGQQSIARVLSHQNTNNGNANDLTLDVIENVIDRYGIAGLTVHGILHRIAQLKESTPPEHPLHHSHCTISILEISTEGDDMLYDLLASRPFAKTKPHNGTVTLRYNPNNNKDSNSNLNSSSSTGGTSSTGSNALFSIVGLSETTIDTMKQFGHLIRRAYTAALHPNRSSKRGHIIVTVNVHCGSGTRNYTPNDSVPSNDNGVRQSSRRMSTTSCQFVDLAMAGYDEDKTTTKENFNGGGYSNGNIRRRNVVIRKSLWALNGVLRGLLLKEAGNDIPISYRESILTKVLQRSMIQTDSRSILLATVAPEIHSYEETMTTLRYVNRLLHRPGKMIQSPFHSGNTESLQSPLLGSPNPTMDGTQDMSSICMEEIINQGRLLKEIVTDPRQRLAKVLQPNGHKAKSPINVQRQSSKPKVFTLEDEEYVPSVYSDPEDDYLTPIPADFASSTLYQQDESPIPERDSPMSPMIEGNMSDQDEEDYAQSVYSYPEKDQSTAPLSQFTSSSIQQDDYPSNLLHGQQSYSSGEKEELIEIDDHWNSHDSAVVPDDHHTAPTPPTRNVTKSIANRTVLTNHNRESLGIYNDYTPTTNPFDVDDDESYYSDNENNMSAIYEVFQNQGTTSIPNNSNLDDVGNNDFSSGNGPTNPFNFEDYGHDDNRNDLNESHTLDFMAERVTLNRTSIKHIASIQGHGYQNNPTPIYEEDENENNSIYSGLDEVLKKGTIDEEIVFIPVIKPSPIANKENEMKLASPSSIASKYNDEDEELVDQSGLLNFSYSLNEASEEVPSLLSEKETSFLADKQNPYPSQDLSVKDDVHTFTDESLHYKHENEIQSIEQEATIQKDVDEYTTALFNTTNRVDDASMTTYDLPPISPSEEHMIVSTTYHIDKLKSQPSERIENNENQTDSYEAILQSSEELDHQIETIDDSKVDGMTKSILDDGTYSNKQSLQHIQQSWKPPPTMQRLSSPSHHQSLQKFVTESQASSIERNQSLSSNQENAAHLKDQNPPLLQSKKTSPLEKNNFPHSTQWNNRKRVSDPLLRSDDAAQKVQDEINQLQAAVDRVKQTNISVWQSSLDSINNLRFFQTAHQETLAELLVDREVASKEIQRLEAELVRQAEMHQLTAVQFEKDLEAAKDHISKVELDKVEVVKIAEEAIAMQSDLEQKVLALERELSDVVSSSIPRQDHDELKRSMELLKIDLVQRNDRISLLSAELDQNKSITSQLKNSLKIAEEKERELLDKLDISQDKISSLNEALVIAQNTKVDAEKREVEMARRYEELRASSVSREDFESLEYISETLENDVNFHKSEVLKLRADIEYFKDTVQKLEMSIQNGEQKQHDLMDEVAQYQSEVSSYKQLLVEAERAEMRAANSAADNARLLNEAQATELTLKGQLQELLEENKRKDDSEILYQKEIDATRMELNAIQEEATAERLKLQRDLSMLKQEVELLHEKNKDLLEHVREYSELKKERDLLSRELSQTKASLHGRIADVRDLTDTVEELLSKREKDQSKIRKMEKALTAFQEETKSRLEVVLLHRNEAASLLEKTVNENKELVSLNMELQAAIETLRDERCDTDDLLQELDSKNTEKLNVLIKENNALVETNKRLIQEVEELRRMNNARNLNSNREPLRLNRETRSAYSHPRLSTFNQQLEATGNDVPLEPPLNRRMFDEGVDNRRGINDHNHGTAVDRAEEVAAHIAYSAKAMIETATSKIQHYNKRTTLELQEKVFSLEDDTDYKLDALNTRIKRLERRISKAPEPLE